MNSLILPLLFLTKSLRTFAFGAVAVIIALYLSACGLSSGQIGFVLTLTLVTDALCTAFITAISHKVGKIRILIIGPLLIVVSGLVLGLNTNPAIVAAAAIIAVGSPSGFEGGPFAAIEQALLAESTESNHLTKVFSWYNIAGFLPAAFGSLAAGLWQGWTKRQGIPDIQSYQDLLLFYAGIGLLLSLLYVILNCLHKDVLNTAQPAATSSYFGLHKSKKVVFELAGLQAIDAFAGGLIVQGLMSYLFHLKYNVGAEDLGLLFFGTNLFATASFLMAPYVSRRIGLIKTIVFTHLPCSLTLCLIPLMPTFTWAAILLLARSLFSSMDIPTRQAFTMLLVEPDERAAAAGFITSTRALSQAAAPALAGGALRSLGVGVPFVVAGLLKSVYDITLYIRFRHSRLS
ncbi:MAG: MFS transporter [Candidatus Obscuribacterales bacterium]|nr:MFS transporter [Candidatus Obscuribacterales bacterium]